MGELCNFNVSLKVQYQETNDKGVVKTKKLTINILVKASDMQHAIQIARKQAFMVYDVVDVKNAKLVNYWKMII